VQISRVQHATRALKSRAPGEIFQAGAPKATRGSSGPSWISGLLASPRLTDEGLQDGAPPHVLRSDRRDDRRRGSASARRANCENGEIEQAVERD
jgi:hypothetical protein